MLNVLYKVFTTQEGNWAGENHYQEKHRNFESCLKHMEKTGDFDIQVVEVQLPKISFINNVYSISSDFSGFFQYSKMKDITLFVDKFPTFPLRD